MEGEGEEEEIRKADREVEKGNRKTMNWEGGVGRGKRAYGRKENG